jgi:hypothetical protein
MEGSGSPSNCEPPLVKKIRGSVNILFYFVFSAHPASFAVESVSGMTGAGLGFRILGFRVLGFRV